jgi:DNA primase small subunit
MPRLDEGGWRTRMRKGIDTLLGELEGLDEKDAKTLLAKMAAESENDIGKKTVDGLYRNLFAGEKGKRGVDIIREKDVFEVFTEKRTADAFIALAETKVKGRMRGETDEPVTSDIKRLIRLPNSLHGKTGFEVIPMTRDQFDDFDPFDDAVSPAFGDAPVRLVLDKPAEVRLRGKSHSVDAGTVEVPEHLAVFLVCRKLARLES